MKNNTRKQTITAAARKLFYEYGYNITSMELIGQNCGAQKQLITYYFGTKEAVGSAVSLQYSAEHKAAFEEAGKKLKLKNPYYATSAYYLWLSRYYKENEKARRFYIEMLCASEISIGPLEEEYLAAKAPENMNLATPSFYDYIESHYAAYWLMYHYVRGELDIESTEFERRFYYRLISPYFTDASRLEHTYMGAKAFLDNLEIETADNFEINIKIKDK